MTPVKFLHSQNRQHHGQRWIAGLVAIAAVIATAGCANGSPDVAAYVGPSSISDSRLHQITVAADEAIGANGQLRKFEVLNGLVLGEIAGQVAEQRNIRISDSERDALAGPSDIGSLLGNADAKELAYGLTDAELVRMRIGDEAFVQALHDATVRINPRYGAWQPDGYEQNLPAVGVLSESLSVPQSGS